MNTVNTEALARKHHPPRDPLLFAIQHLTVAGAKKHERSEGYRRTRAKNMSDSFQQAPRVYFGHVVFQYPPARLVHRPPWSQSVVTRAARQYGPTWHTTAHELLLEIALANRER